MKLLRMAAVAALAFGLAAGTAMAQDVASFYSGKTVKVLIGYSAGGGYDAYGRLLARHLGDHIPGHPNVVAQNMPGAGSLKLMNYLANVAPKDGTELGAVSRGAPVQPLFGGEGANFKSLDMNWIGSLTDEVSVCASWHDTGITSFDQLLDGSKQMIVGGTGPASDVEVFTRLVKNMFGANLKLISGYPGGKQIVLAMERGELQGRCGWSVSSMLSGHEDWVKNGTVDVLVELALKRSKLLPDDIPLITDYAKTKEQQQVLKLILSRLQLARPYVAPPGIPKDRVDALRKAFMDTASDPAFIAEAKKLGLELNPTDGSEAQQMLEDIFQTDPAIIKKGIAVVAPPSS